MRRQVVEEDEQEISAAFAQEAAGRVFASQRFRSELLRELVRLRAYACVRYRQRQGQPIYNYENETKALYCSVHKEDGMVDVKNAKCKHEGRKTQPRYVGR